MTIQQAVNLAVQHSGALDLVIDDDDTGGFYAVHSVRPTTIGDGGFTYLRHGAQSDVIAWSKVQSWVLRIEERGHRAGSATVLS